MQTLTNLILLGVTVASVSAGDSEVRGKLLTFIYTQPDLRLEDFPFRKEYWDGKGTDNLRSSDFSGRTLFEKSCAKCHGRFGGGNDLLSEDEIGRVFPFTAYLLRWKTTRFGQPASRHDIGQAIAKGIPRTKMPSFPNLKPAEFNKLVEYVLLLAVVGDATRGFVFNPDKQHDIAGLFAENRKKWQEIDQQSSVYAMWDFSQGDPLRGEKLFNGKRALCYPCHGVSGKGVGKLQLQFYKGSRRQTFPEPGLHDSLDRKLILPDLRTDPFKGGESAYDIACRIAAGIPSSKMPSYQQRLSDSEIIDVVSYVLSIRSPPKDRTVRRERNPAAGD